MRTVNLSCLAVALAILSAPAPLVARPNLSKGPLFVAEAERKIDGGRAVQIALQTPAIGASVELGRVAENPSRGGSTDGWYWWSGPISEVAGIMRMSVREAEVRAEPLRQALQDFDSTTLALNATRSGIEAVGWIEPHPLELLKEPRQSSPLDFVAAAPSAQVAMIDTGFYLSPDCGQIEAKAEIRVLRKTGKKVSVVAYQQVTSVVQLSKPSLDPKENVRRWSTDKAGPARRAIAAAFARLQILIPRSLALTSGQVTGYAAKAQTMVQAAGRFGPVLDRGADGSVLVWSNGLVSVAPLPPV